MKIFTVLFFLAFSLFSFSPAFSYGINDFKSDLKSNKGCSWSEGDTVAGALGGCAPEKAITSTDYNITGGLKAKVVRITNQLIIAGSLLAVGAIVFAAVLYTMALGDAEKVKKAKTSLKFAIVGFALMLLSYAIVNAIVNLVYGIK